MHPLDISLNPKYKGYLQERELENTINKEEEPWNGLTKLQLMEMNSPLSPERPFFRLLREMPSTFPHYVILKDLILPVLAGYVWLR